MRNFLHIYVDKRTFLHKFGQNLGGARARLGFTQSEFAAKLGVARRTQINYENGDRAPDASYLFLLMQLGVNVQQLFYENANFIGAEGVLASESINHRDYAVPQLTLVYEAIVAVVSDVYGDAPRGEKSTTVSSAASHTPSAERVAEAIVSLVEVSHSVEAIHTNKESVLRLIRRTQSAAPQ